MNEVKTYTEKELHPGKVISHKVEKDYIEIKCEEQVTLRIHILNDYIIRFRYCIGGFFENDFSYGIDPSYTPSSAIIKTDETDDYLNISTAAVTCRVNKKNSKICILDNQGNIINEEEKGFHWENNPTHGGHIVQMTKKIKKDEAYYGLGDKPTDLNIRGKRFVNWGTDEYGYERDTDPLYKNIPIYYGLQNGIGYGIFFDNSFKSHFDFGKERNTAMSFWAMGGEMNYYFIAGPQLMDVCRRYTMLTGTPDLPPMWALGFQQCKWSYYPESKVKEITQKMRDLRIPCDAIYLDIDYMDGFRCFTWDKEKFPDPKGMISKLKTQGFKTIVIIDPGIKIDQDYSVFKEGLEAGHFCKHADGPYAVGKVWPGDCYFPDFTKPAVREWWAELYKELIEETGVDGVWNDMNEPALFEVEGKTFPNTVMHDYDGNPTSHRKAHNVYGMQMARATAEGVKKYRNGKRTLIITRSGYSGLQRYSSVWMGDNIATWEHLWIADVQAQRLAISGISFCGSDIGGFIEQPTPELMIRWIQLGIFHPFCRVHSSGDHGDQEPWSFGEECVEQFRKAVEFRYQLLPYIYTSFYQYHKYGTPMLRPLVFFDQSDTETISRDHEFLCGEHLLVCPVVTEKNNSRQMYLPKGSWYNFYTKNKIEGGRTIRISTPIDKTPLFIKAGAILPLYPIQQYVGEIQFDEITLNIYHIHGTETSHLYEDNHEDFKYENGEHHYATFTTDGDENQLKITQITEGSYNLPYSYFIINAIKPPFSINEIVVDGNRIEVESTIKIPVQFKTLVLRS